MRVCVLFKPLEEKVRSRHRCSNYFIDLGSIDAEPLDEQMSKTKKKRNKEATHWGDPFLTTTALPRPVVVAQFCPALLIRTGDLPC